MAFIDWDPAWSVGNSVIDYDHQMLVNITNELMALITRRGVKQAEVDKMFDHLVQYTKTHFAREEAMFSDTDYPDAETHKEMHRTLTRTIEDIARLNSREGDTLNFREIGDFLRRWLTNHIAKHDRGYAPHLG